MPWFVHAGFTISSSPLPMGQVRLQGANKDKELTVLLKPHSPLATEVWIETFDDQSVGKNYADGLWHYLTDYLASISHEPVSADQEVPPQVRVLADSVVCIKAIQGDDEAQVSGFLVDRQGLLISAAHGLTDYHTITVILPDGREFNGILIKRDPTRDLALIRINYEPPSYISLLKGRNSLKIGERLFTIGCPNNLDGIMHSGTINGPPRMVGNQPLWQINMEIHHGSSGSPVFDGEGNLVAVVKGKLRGTNTVGFLIPYETIIEFLNGT